MMRSRILSRFEEVYDNALPLLIGAWLILQADRYRWTVAALALILYALVSKSRHLLVPALILSVFLIPLPRTDPDMHEGRVITVRDSYVIVQNGNSRMLVYTASRPILDSVIRYDGVSSALYSSNGFYQFDFAAYCRRQGITRSISPETITVIKPSRSPRGFLMKRILDSGSPHRDLLLDILFQIHAKDNFQGIFRDRGFSLAGVLLFLNWILKYVLCDKPRKRVILSINILLCGFFHFPYLLTRRLIYAGLIAAGLSGRKAKAVSFLIGLRLFPWVVNSASFIIPAVYAFVPDRLEQKRLHTLFFGMSMESVLFHSVNPIELLIYPFLMPVTGFFWLLALLEAITGLSLIMLVPLADQILSCLSWFEIPGSLIGFGLLFFLLSLLQIRNGKHRMRSACILFLLFQLLGLFHPLAEITFINVGQGDSILIRGPCSTSDILIDTGKPSQWRAVETMLKAKGIRKLDALIITHSDNDHSGNQQNVIDTFHPKTVITAHHEPLSCGFLKLYDLNPIQSDDANESSITDYFLLNGMRIFLTGDADKNTEEAIVHRYPDLSCDLLKASHHGSNTGNSDLLLNTVRPYLIIISSGAYSIYHHPNPNVITRFNARRIPWLDTKQEGDISILCFPFFNVLLTAGGKIDIIRL
ncbi:MAG: MBL fold metallo-hydrolase [Solobacterium sp.]|nr:MBL fold metallo-hydrolase [Solobacterium sp.]